MKLNPLFKVVLPGLVIAAVCLCPVSNSAQDSNAIRIDTRAGAPLQGPVADPSGSAFPQQPDRTITLDPPTGLDLQAHTVDSKGNLLPPVPANFQRLGEARVGEPADLHTLTLRFSKTTKITGISVSKDFKIEQGGSCVEGNVYEKGSTCRLLVRFTPQGPGNRLGKLTVSHTGSITPDTLGLGGNGYAPVVSFIPSVITTVRATYGVNNGLLSGAQNLAIDGSDALWIADSGSGKIDQIDSSGALKTLASGYTGAFGIAVDTAGDAYFDVPSANKMYWITVWGQVEVASGSTQQTCTVSAACYLSATQLSYPGEMSMDAYNGLFFVDGHEGAASTTVQLPGPSLVFLSNQWYVPPVAMAVGVYDNLYTYVSFQSGQYVFCGIMQQSVFNVENGYATSNKVAGGFTCGFAGDGGLAGNAEIGSTVGQIAFDAAGDLYFTDTANQRVRRIDYNTGIIRTVAGNGTAGYTGDGIGSIGAELASPTGVGVDSQGQIYIISGAAATGTAQEVRKVTTVGYRNFGYVVKGTKATFTPIIVTNTGNFPLQITNTSFTGPNASEFAIDPTITTCALTPGATLAIGQTCQIGFTATPASTGLRTAYFNLLDNSVTGVNVVDLYATGILPSATFKITSPSNGASYTSGTAVPFKVSVTSGSGPAPTGTVQFKVDGANFGSAVTLASGAASTNVTGLSVTSHTLSATYSGDTNYAAGGAISVSITVTGTVPPPAVMLVPMMSTANTCGPLSFEVAVTGKAGSVPTGAIQLMNGQSQVASGTLAGGKAVLMAPSLHPGTYAFTAHYGGDGHNQPAVSPVLTQTVSQLGGCVRQEGSVH